IRLKLNKVIKSLEPTSCNMTNETLEDQRKRHQRERQQRHRQKRAALTTITINKADGDITGSEPEKIFNNSRENANYKETSRERCLRLRREAARRRNERETLEDTAARLKKRREAAVQRKQNQTPEDAARFRQSKRQRYTHIVDTSIIEPPNAISP
ncbi:18050_t:CDS:1, partial [Acaulospora morrowiae]